MKSFFCWLFLLPLTVFAQQRDSVLQVIEVYGIPPEKFLVGSQLNEIDSSITKADRAASVSDVMARQFPIYFRNYGNGMISGISLRGTAPQHTAVLWNGININSFSLGQADFSILPSNAFESIKLHEGGGSAKFGSGAMGGTVLLNSIQGVEKNKLEVSQQAGSFQTFSTSVSNELKLQRWAIATRLYNIQSENNFPIEGLGRQPHASYYQRGLLQDLIYGFSDARNLQLSYWVHQASREIQPSIGQATSINEQQDVNHRLSVTYRAATGGGFLNSTVGYVRDVIVYNNSESTISRLIAKVGHQYAVTEKIQTELTAEANYITADIEEYASRASEYRFDVFGGISLRPADRLSISLNVRQPFVTGFNAPLLPYIGAEYKLMHGTRSLSWTANASRNYRIPTFNDRYWQDAGSKELVPESSYSAETSLIWLGGPIRIQPLLYAQTISEWIQWVPDEKGNYEPRNVKRVGITGGQMRITFTKVKGNFTFTANAHYQYTKSLVKDAPPSEQYSVGKQLTYTPVHTAAFSVRLQRAQAVLMINSQFNSVRFIDSSNTQLYALDAYQLLNISLSQAWTHHRHVLRTGLNVNNVFDHRYQMYAGHAMPGRNFNIQLTYQLNYR